MASLLTDAIASLGRWQAFRSYDGESSAHEWLEDLEETMDKMGYRQSSFVERASEKLQGEAKSWYRWWREYDQPGPLSWEDFKATFLDEFGLSTSDWEERLVTCQQCLQEPTQAYSNRFTTYARRANRMNDPSLVTLYVRGLKKSLSEALDLFGRRTPTSTLKEVMRAAANLSRCNWRALLADEELPPEPAGRRVRFEDSRTTDRPRSPWTRNADVRREEERRYSRPGSNGSSGGGGSGGGGGHRGGSSTAPVGGGGGNGGGGNRDRDRNDRNLATPHDLARLHTQMSRLSLNMRDRSDGGARGRGRYGGELNMVWRDYEGSEGSLYPDSDSEYDDALEGELLASEQKRFRDFDLGQRLPRSREPFSPDTRMEVDRRAPRHYTAGGRLDETPASKLPRPQEPTGGPSRPLLQRPVVTATAPPPRPAAGLSRAPPPQAAGPALAARGVREAAARPLPDTDRPRPAPNTRAPGAGPAPAREEPRAAPLRSSAAAATQPQRALPPDPKPPAPRVPPRTDPVTRTEEAQVAEDVFAKIAAHSITLAKAAQCDSRAILAKVGGKCLGLARSASGGAGGSNTGVKSGLLAEAQPAAPEHRSDGEEDSPGPKPPQKEYQICRVRAACLDINGNEREQRTCADTGASNCVIARRAVSGLGLLNYIRDTRTKFYHANGSEDRAKGKVSVTVCLPGLTRAVEMYVSDAENYDLLLGNDFLGPLRVDTRYSNMTLEYDDNSGQRRAVPIKITRSSGRQRNVPLARLDTHAYVVSTTSSNYNSGAEEAAACEEAGPDTTPSPLQPTAAATPPALGAHARRLPRRHHPGVRPTQLFLLDGNGSSPSAMAVDAPTPDASNFEPAVPTAGSDKDGTSSTQAELPPANMETTSEPATGGAGEVSWVGDTMCCEPLFLNSKEITSQDLTGLVAMLADTPPKEAAPAPAAPTNSPRAKVVRQLFSWPADAAAPPEDAMCFLVAVTTPTVQQANPSHVTLAEWLDKAPDVTSGLEPILPRTATQLPSGLSPQEEQQLVGRWLQACTPPADMPVRTVTTANPATGAQHPVPEAFAAGVNDLPLKEILAAVDGHFGGLLVSPEKEGLVPLSPFTATDSSGGYLSRADSPGSPPSYMGLLQDEGDDWYGGATGLPLPRGKRGRKASVFMADCHSPLSVWSGMSGGAESPPLIFTQLSELDDEWEVPPLAPPSDDEDEAPALMGAHDEYDPAVGWSRGGSPRSPPTNQSPFGANFSGRSGGATGDGSGGGSRSSRAHATADPMDAAVVELFVMDADGFLRRPSRDEVLSLPPTEHLQLAQEYGRRQRELRGPPDPNDARVQTMRERWTCDGTELSPELQQVLLDNYDLFALDDSQLGRTDWVEAAIDTGDAPPVCLNPYRHSRVETEAMEAEVRRMLGAGIIRHSTSAWSSPVVMVRKSDGTHRFCVDLRGVNNVTQPVRFPMPHVRDLIDTLAPPLGEQRVYSCMDLKSGFWQVGVQESDRCKLAFQAPSGLYEFCVLPMGARASPALFQRLMTLVLRPVLASGAGLGYHPTPTEETPRKCCVLFIDDICIWSPSQQEHAADVLTVLDLLRLAGLVLSLKKCKFGTPKCQFLGHVVDGVTGHITPSPDNVEAIRSYPKLRTVRQVKAFLGLTSYYREQVDHFANVALPLYQCLGKMGFHWGERQATAFEALKEAITSFPILRAPDFTRPFTLATDFAKTAVAACLSQHDEDGREYVVSFASKKLNDTQANWSSTDGEAFAAMWAITKVYHAYLYGTHFTLVTDNSALTYIMKTKDLTGKLARYALKLAPYTFTIVHRAGRKNGNADGLSRLGHLRDAPSDEEDEDSPQRKPKRPAAAAAAIDLESLADAFEAETLLFMAGSTSPPRYAEVCVLERLPSLTDGIGGELFEDEWDGWPASWRERLGEVEVDGPASQQLPDTPTTSLATMGGSTSAPNPLVALNLPGEQDAGSSHPPGAEAATARSVAPPPPVGGGGGGNGSGGNVSSDNAVTPTLTIQPLTLLSSTELSTDHWWRQWWGLPKASPSTDSADGATTSTASGDPVHLNMVEAGASGGDEERPTSRRRPLSSLASPAAQTVPGNANQAPSVALPLAATAVAAAPGVEAGGGAGGSMHLARASASISLPPSPRLGTAAAAVPSVSAATAPPPPYPGSGHAMAMPGPWLRPFSGGSSVAAAAPPGAAVPHRATSAAAAAPAAAATATPRRRQLRAARKPQWLRDYQGEDSVDTLARLACAVCHSRHPEWNMLLCDYGDCASAYHTTCLSPPLSGVPEGDWFCPKHNLSVTAAASAAPTSTPTKVAATPAAAAAAGPTATANANPVASTAVLTSAFATAAVPTTPPRLKPPLPGAPASSNAGTTGNASATATAAHTTTATRSAATPSATAGVAPGNTRADSGEDSDAEEDGDGAASDDDGGYESAGSVLEIDGVPQFHPNESRVWHDHRLLQFLRDEDEFMPEDGEAWGTFYKEIQRVTKKARRYHWEAKDGTLWKRATSKRPAVRVLKFRERLPAIEEVHGRGHQGWRSCFDALRNRFYWDGMAHDIRVYVATCAACQPSKHVLVRQTTLRPLSVVGIWRRVHLDLCGPYEPTARGDRYVILAVDSWSKWPEVGLLPNKSSETTARWFYENFITRFGSPELVYTDRGGEWEGDFKALLQREHIMHRRTQAYTPSTNGQCERLVGVLRHALIRHLQHTEEKNWANFVYSVVYSYRITPQASTGASPALCLYGRELTTAAERPVPAAAGEDDDGGYGGPLAAAAHGSEPATDEEAFAAEPQQLEARRATLDQLAERVQARLEKAQAKQVRNHARRNIKSAMPKPRPALPLTAAVLKAAAAGTGAYGVESDDNQTQAPSEDGDGGGSGELPRLTSPTATKTQTTRRASAAAAPRTGTTRPAAGRASSSPAVADLSPRDQTPRGQPPQPPAAAAGTSTAAQGQQAPAVVSPLKNRRQRQQQAQAPASATTPRGGQLASQAATSALTGFGPNASPPPRGRRAQGSTAAADAKLNDYDARLATLPDLRVGDAVYRRRRPRNKLTSDREGPYAFQAFHPLLTHILVRDQNGLEFAIPLHDVFAPKNRC